VRSRNIPRLLLFAAGLLFLSGRAVVACNIQTGLSGEVAQIIDGRTFTLSSGTVVRMSAILIPRAGGKYDFLSRASCRVGRQCRWHRSP
jgi:hypothetical protein